MEELKPDLQITLGLQFDNLSQWEQELYLNLALDVNDKNETIITNRELAKKLRKSLTGISIGISKLEDKGRITRRFDYNRNVPGKLIRIIKLK